LIKGLSGFVSTWKTDNISTGSSASNQVQLPLESTGTYNFSVDWGDGSSNEITTYNQAEIIHTYSEAGTFIIKINGTINGFNFNNTKDKLKLLSVQKWGLLKLGGSTYNFFGCSNLDLSTVSDVLDTSNKVTFLGCFRGCSALTTINRINEWNFNNAITISQMFWGATLFNQSLNWSTPNLNNTASMFYAASTFNSPMSITTNNVTTMAGMFQNTFAFNQDISHWNFSSCTSLSVFMSGKTSANYSAANYDSLLISLSNQTLQPNVSPNFGTIKYTSTATSAKSILTSSPNNWVISDGGLI